ncbi:MAG: radical SAM/SPASM domain-containing protein [Candidatus Tectimicrobiota bacterium]
MDSPKRPALVPTLPRSLYLETTNRCDSACQTCIRTFNTLEPPKDLALEEVQHIVEQFPGLERVVLHGIGEPLLNKHIFEIVAYLKARHITVLFNSDAISLTPARAEQLIASGLDEYRVSMDAATRETYAALRGVDQFERVIRNLGHLVTLQRQRGCDRPRVSIWFTTLKANLQELPDFIRLADRLGVREVNAQRLVFNGYGLAVQEQSLHRRLEEQELQLIQNAEVLAQEYGIVFKASGATTPLQSLHGEAAEQRPWGGCQRPWTLSYVTANGNVLPCCISPWTTTQYRHLVLGNALTTPFAQVWNGAHYQQFRQEFESDVAPDPCRGCGWLWSF